MRCYGLFSIDLGTGSTLIRLTNDSPGPAAVPDIHSTSWNSFHKSSSSLSIHLSTLERVASCSCV